LIFDTETTGLPKARLPSSRGPNNWPHIVSISWVILDAHTNKVVDIRSFVIKPRNWTIPEDSIKIHGITQEKAEKEFGIKRSQFCVHKKALEQNQSFRKDPVTKLLVAD
jgi:DNA polymerase III epsilon subunit-like protein